MLLGTNTGMAVYTPMYDSNPPQYLQAGNYELIAKDMLFISGSEVVSKMFKAADRVWLIELSVPETSTNVLFDIKDITRCETTFYNADGDELDLDDLTYTGESLQPASVKVVDRDHELVEGVDYEIDYDGEWVNPSNEDDDIYPIVTITGLGDYGGSTAEFSWYINKAVSNSHTVIFMSEDGNTVLDIYDRLTDGYVLGSYYNSYNFTNKDSEWLFLGWYKADDTKFDFGQPITDDLTVHEKWVLASEYNGIVVTLKMFDDEFTKLILESGDKIPEMYRTYEVPGMIFGGWYNGDTLFDLDTPVTESMTLTAKLTKDPNFTGHYVTFKDSGKIYDIVGVEDGDTIPWSPNRPADHDGYEFAGWYYGDTKWGDVVVTEDIEITGKWVLADNIGARLAGNSLILGDDIGVNFYMELSDTIRNSQTAKMIFTIPNSGNTTTLEIPVSEIVENPELCQTIDGKTYYIFPCHVAAKEMTSEIKAQIVDAANDLAGTVFSYTVKQYADYIIARPDEYGEKTVALVKAMLYYGGTAQTLFNFNTTVSADADLIDYAMLYSVPESFDECGLANINAAANAHGLQLTNVSLILESKTTLRLYFKRIDPSSTDELPELTDGTNTYTPAAKGDEFCCSITGFGAGALFEKRSVHFTGGDVFDVCIGDYCNWAMTQSDNSMLSETIKALFNYDMCAKAYAESI